MRSYAVNGMCTLICAGLVNLAPAQVVQLPSVSTFSYSGAAWVPDGGTAALAGNSTARSASVNSGWGPYGPRASGSMYGTSAVSASVQIIDLQALDEAILSTRIPQPVASAPRTPNRTPNNSSRNLVGGAAAPGPAAHADPGKWQRVLAGGHPSTLVHSQTSEADIRFYLKMGQEAEAANRVIAARVYYRMAVEAMTPQMKDRYQRNLADRAAAEKAAAALVKTDRQRF